MKARAHRNRIPKFLLCLGLRFCCLWVLILAPNAAFAQTNTNADTEKESQIAALKKQRDDAIEQVKKIVNQPVARYARPPGINVAVFPDGWFHPGAPVPDFDHVDVRQTQEFSYDSHPYVASGLMPGVVFRGTDLEFNEMTKYFYTDRSVPKKKLTEAEMLEINRLYRIIGDCKKNILHLSAPPSELIETPATETESESPPVRQPVPRENYIKAAIGVSAILLVYVLYLLLRRLKSS